MGLTAVRRQMSMAARKAPRRFAPLGPDRKSDVEAPVLKGVIFDMDGTLCKSNGLCSHVLCRVLLSIEVSWFRSKLPLLLGGLRGAVPLRRIVHVQGRYHVNIVLTVTVIGEPQNYMFAEMRYV